jgi:hypothetical protein
MLDITMSTAIETTVLEGGFTIIGGDIRIDFSTNTIEYTNPMKEISVLDFHRMLQETFDEPSMLVHPNPTARIADDIIRVLPPYNIRTPIGFTNGSLII